MLTWLSFFCGAVALIGIFAWRAYTQRTRSPRDQERQYFQQQLLELEDPELDDEAFYNKAAECAEYLIKQDASKATELEEILRRRDEINYGARKTFFKSDERQRILEVLTENREKS